MNFRLNDLPKSTIRLQAGNRSNPQKLAEISKSHKYLHVIYKKRVRVFYQGFQTPKK